MSALKDHGYIKALREMASSSSASREQIKLWCDGIGSCEAEVESGPKAGTNFTNDLLRINREILSHEAESIFGPSDSEFELYETPVYDARVPNSRLALSMEDKPKLMMVINRSAHTWEDAFYEIAHEAIHLLSPVITEGKPEVAALDEGVAVYFAEFYYDKYIKMYTGRSPMLSPAGSSYNHREYAQAYAIARKLTFDELRKIRYQFRGFPNVRDAGQLHRLCAGKLSLEEAESITGLFKYW